MPDPTMPYRRLGNAGVRVSALSLGGWTTFGGSIRDAGSVRSILRAAYEAGISFFDMADIYARGEAERLMGLALKELPRHTLVLSSKVFWPMSDDPNDRGLSRKHIIESVERSLRRIGTDYLDLYFCHRFDPETPVDETLRAMDDLVRQGKVLYWGTSEWSGSQLQDAHAIARRGNHYAPQVEQPQLSLAARARYEADVQPAAVELGMGLVVWSPLASGLLTGKYDDELPEGSRLAKIDWLRESILTEENRRRARELKAVAEEAGCSRAQLAIAWALAQPGVSSVILGATSEAQLEENLGALRVSIDKAMRRRLDAIFPPG